MKEKTWLFLILLWASLNAQAKIVTLKWNSDSEAIQYEINIEKEGATVLNVFSKVPSWNGDLGYGIFMYQIRAIDALGRNGEWSAMMPLVVLPPPPTLLSPKSGESFKIFGGQSLTLEWSIVKGATNYRVEVYKDENLILEKSTNESSIQIADLTTGKYKWKVQAQLNSFKDKLVADRTWSTPYTDTRDFAVIRTELQKSKLLFPLGDTWPSNDGKLIFMWESVNGAAAYDVYIESLSDKKQIKTFRTEGTSIEVFVGEQGHFSWGITPLGDATQGPSTFNKVLNSKADFHLVQSEVDPINGWQIVLLSGSKYRGYDFIDTTKNIHGISNSATSLAQMEIDKYWSKIWSSSLCIDLDPLSLGSKNLIWGAVQFWQKYRSELNYGWWWSVGGGIEAKQFPLLSPLQYGTSTDFSAFNLESLGIYGKIARNITPKWNANLELKMYYPIWLISGEPGASIGNTGFFVQNREINLNVKKLLGTKSFLQFSTSIETRSLNIQSPSAAIADQISALNNYIFKIGWGGQF